MGRSSSRRRAKRTQAVTHPNRATIRTAAAERVRRGERLEVVATSCGRSTGWLYKACRDLGVSLPPRRPRTPAPDKGLRSQFARAILPLLSDNRRTFQSIADEVGVSAEYVRQVQVVALGAGRPVADRIRSLGSRRRRKQLAADRVAGGESVEDLARELGVTRSWLIDACRAGDVPGIPKAWSRSQAAARRQRCVEEVLAGDAPAAVAARHGVSPSVVYDACLRAGLRLRRGKAPVAPHPAIVERVRQLGGSVDATTAIAAELGLGPDYVRSIYLQAQRKGKPDTWSRQSRAAGRQAAVKRVRRGESLAKVAEAMGHTPAWVYRACRAAGLKLKPGRRLSRKQGANETRKKSRVLS